MSLIGNDEKHKKGRTRKKMLVKHSSAVMQGCSTL